MSESSDSPDLRRLRALALQRCSGTLAEDGVEELSELLNSSAQARKEYLEITSVYAKLKWDLGSGSAGRRSVAQLPAACVDPDATLPRSASTPRLLFWSVAIAACTLLSITLGLMGRQGRQAVGTDRDAIADRGQPETLSEQIVGSVTAVAAQSSWTFERSGATGGQDFYRGDTISVDEGEVELRLQSGTVALLQAPAVMQVASLERVNVLQGSVRVEVPDGAEGFTVETASAEVVDLGTVFSVGVENGETDVVVFEGKVDLKVRDPIQRSDQPRSNEYKRFRAGEAVHVASDGTLSRIVNVTSPNVGLEQQQPLITSVKDNIARADTWDFYEIMPNGMGEDQRAYVDRPHEWNGATDRGMPSYLLNGDYVKTFCNDKITTDIRIEVALSRPAVLFVLFDKRLTPPDWLVASFEATGDDIGIDETDFNVWKQERSGEDQLRVGPGRGIERSFSIWRKVVNKPGSVSLGPNGTPIREIEPLDLNAEMAMYGIVAVPLK